MSDKFNELVDRNGRAFFTYAVVSRWIGFTNEMISCLFITGATLYAFFSVNADQVAASQMALALTSSLGFF